jgi:hypothetical protein
VTKKHTYGYGRTVSKRRPGTACPVAGSKEGWGIEAGPGLCWGYDHGKRRFLRVNPSDGRALLFASERLAEACLRSVEDQIHVVRLDVPPADRGGEAE